MYVFCDNNYGFKQINEQRAPSIEILKGDNSIFNSVWDEENVIWDNANETLAISNINRAVYGDLSIVCSELASDGKPVVLFRYWVHTHFLPFTVDDESSIGATTVRLFVYNYLLMIISICLLWILKSWIFLMIVHYPVKFLCRSR